MRDRELLNDLRIGPSMLLQFVNARAFHAKIKVSHALAGGWGGCSASLSCLASRWSASARSATALVGASGDQESKPR